LRKKQSDAAAPGSQLEVRIISHANFMGTSTFEPFYAMRMGLFFGFKLPFPSIIIYKAQQMIDGRSARASFMAHPSYSQLFISVTELHKFGKKLESHFNRSSRRFHHLKYAP
jgi:hypothetical protein